MLLGVALLYGAGARAEAPGQAPAAGAPAQQQGQQQRPSNGRVEVFDNNMWNSVGQSPSAPAQINGRYAAPEGNYNTQTRANALEACANLKDVDSRSYRECYERQMKQQEAAVQDSIQRSQRRLTNPLRDTMGSSVPSPLDVPERAAPESGEDEND